MAQVYQNFLHEHEEIAETAEYSPITQRRH